MVETQGLLRRAARHGRQRVRALGNVLLSRDYPASVAVSSANQRTIDFISRTQSRMVAEIGIYEGHTSEAFAKFLDGRGELHLYDFQDRVKDVEGRLRASGWQNIVAYPNSHKTMDSYNWSLMRVLQAHAEPLYDYVFLDGAHTWSVDALTFFLVDKLLKVGGYIDFDDYGWSLASSQSLNPAVFPATGRMYTAEQINEAHVKLIVDLLVRRDVRYVEVVKNKIFQKTAAAPPA